MGKLFWDSNTDSNKQKTGKLDDIKIKSFYVI